MSQLSRTRQRAALVALVGGVSGVDAAYGYPPDPDTPELVGKVYAVIGMYQTHMLNTSGGKAGVFMTQKATWFVSLLRRTAPVGKIDNATRQQLVNAFDPVVDAVEYALFNTAHLSDGSGVIAANFGNDIKCVLNTTEFASDRALSQATFILGGEMYQQT